MADQTAGQGLSIRSAPPAGGAPAAHAHPGHRATRYLALGAFGLLGVYSFLFEGSLTNALYIVGVTLTCAGVLALVTRRLLASTIVSVALAAIIVLAAAVKVELMHMTVHAYDVVYYLSSPATVSYLAANYPKEMIALFGSLGALAAAWFWLHRLDATRAPRAFTATGLVCLAGLTWLAAKSADARADWRMFEGGLALTKFYNSWPETIETILKGQLFEASPETGPAPPPFKLPASCVTEQKPPHVILIHEESVVPPEYFPSLTYDKGVDRMFRSFDGRLHKLRVETYAGASWLTEYSILTGVSTYSFGSMRTFVQALMAGKVRDTLPETFKRCGYRNVVFYPLSKNFASNGRFYESIGMGEIFDVKDQGARMTGERDRFYYDNMLKLFDEHIRTSRQPIFSYVLTIGTHQPYNWTFEPDVDVPGGGPGTEPGMHEFLRRLSLAHIDLESLKKELKARYPSERFLIVHYGDHQPTSTWSYLSEAEQAAIRSEDRRVAQASPPFQTYFAVEGVNYDPPALPAFETLDVPYLGLVTLEAAKLPLTDSYLERRKLMQACGGRYATCDNQTAVLDFHRRLMDSGLMVAR